MMFLLHDAPLRVVRECVVPWSAPAAVGSVAHGNQVERHDRHDQSDDLQHVTLYDLSTGYIQSLSNGL
jgi:hypothetical protein